MSAEFLGGTRSGRGRTAAAVLAGGEGRSVRVRVRPGRDGRQRRDRAGRDRGADAAALKNVERALALAGCTLADVVKATVWLDDTRDFWSFNRVYAEYFPADKPARSTTQAKLMVDAKIEIEVIAYG